MKNVICISGKAGHGKDTAAEVMKKELESKYQKVCIMHYGDYVKYIAEKYFGWDGKKDKKGRDLLQWLGTDKVRAMYPNFWVERVSDLIKIFNDYFDYTLIPDTRFPNEINLMRELGHNVISVRIIRENYESTLTKEQQNHLSETALDDFEFDHVISSPSGIENLANKVKCFVKELGISTAMRREIISTVGLLPDVIEKDLSDDQRICPHCKGLGMVVEDFMYGNDEGKVMHPNKRFPWNNKYIGFCNHCYFGVQKLCPHCHEPYPNQGYLRCECDGAKKERFEKSQQKLQETYNKAEKITLQEAKNRGMKFLCDTNDRYYNIDDVFEDLEDEHCDDPDFVMPKWMFATKVHSLSFSIDNILENATDDLYEDARDCLSGVDELEKFLNDWAAKQSGADTYYPNNKIVVMLEEPNVKETNK